MIDRVEKISALYDVTIEDIFLKYCDLKTLNKEKKKILYDTLENYFFWLETQENINALNIIVIVNRMLEYEEIRKNLVNNNFEELLKTTEKNLKKIDFSKINQDINSNEKFMYINMETIQNINYYLKKEKNIIPVFEQLTLCDLIFRDLVKLLLENCCFSGKLESCIYSISDCITIINKLNIIYYHLNKIINSTRKDLYYCSLFLLENTNVTNFLFDDLILTRSSFNSINQESKYIVYTGIIKGLGVINKYYSIEIPEYNYQNIRKNIYNLKNNEESFITYISSILSVSNKIFLYSIAFKGKEYVYGKNDLQELSSLIETLRQYDNVFIMEQTLSNKQRTLLEESIDYVKKYAETNKLELKNYIYIPNPKWEYSQLFLEFYINLNNFDYKFSIRKVNNNLTWNVNLKNKKRYKINLYLKDDFRHILQAVFYDKNITFEGERK